MRSREHRPAGVVAERVQAVLERVGTVGRDDEHDDTRRRPRASGRSRSRRRSRRAARRASSPRRSRPGGRAPGSRSSTRSAPIDVPTGRLRRAARARSSSSSSPSRSPAGDEVARRVATRRGTRRARRAPRRGWRRGCRARCRDARPRCASCRGTRRPRAAAACGAPPRASVATSISVLAASCGTWLTSATSTSWCSGVTDTTSAPSSRTQRRAARVYALASVVGGRRQHPRRADEQVGVGAVDAFLLGAGHRVAADEARRGCRAAPLRPPRRPAPSPNRRR